MCEWQYQALEAILASCGLRAVTSQLATMVSYSPHVNCSLCGPKQRRSNRFLRLTCISPADLWYSQARHMAAAGLNVSTAMTETAQ